MHSVACEVPRGTDNQHSGNAGTDVVHPLSTRLHPWPARVAKTGSGFCVEFEGRRKPAVHLNARTMPEAVGEAIELGVAGDIDMSPPQREERREPVTVYFIAGEVGAIKIGVAADPIGRLSTLQCGSPVPLRIHATCEGGAKAEREYHRRFAAHRLHGEWFERHPDILAEIERLANHNEMEARHGQVS